MKYDFQVPENKRVRYIISTDCANEADDQFAVAHILMTQKMDVKGIVAAHFDLITKMSDRYPSGGTVKASYDETVKVLELMGLQDEYKVYMGSGVPLTDEKTPIITEGARFIIEEAMRDDPRPLYIGCQGCLTDVACAILMEPAICQRMTCIWIGGGDYPEGDTEFNLMQDICAANVVFASSMPVWQIPKKVYKSLSVSLAELQWKVKPCGALGRYLFRQMAELNTALAGIPHWPHGEIWGLGDQGVISVLMQESERVDNFRMIPAPRIDPRDMHYIHGQNNREIRVYEYIDHRLTLEDLFAKLAINYG